VTVHEIVVTEADKEWTDLDPPGPGNRGKLVKWLSGAVEGSPSVTFSHQPEGYENPAHFHSEAQFQVLLEGSVSFPQHRLAPIAVHYSDARTPYGPFLVGAGFKLAVLRVRPATQTHMSDREGRRARNPQGRELYGQTEGTPWRQLTGELTGVEQKQLIVPGPSGGPTATLFRCEPNTTLPCPPAPHGTYQLLVEGDASVDDERLEPYAVRFALGQGSPRPLTTGPRGARLLHLAFDAG
jgi:hypothetical protein